MEAMHGVCVLLLLYVRSSYGDISFSGLSGEIPMCVAEEALPVLASSVESANRLIYPKTIENLLEEHFEKQPFVVRRRSPKFYDSLIGLGDVLAVIEEGRSESDPSRRIEYGTEWKLIRRVMRDGKWWTGLLPGGENITAQIAQAAFYRHGFSLVVNTVQNRLLGVYSAARSLEDALGWRVNVNMYMSPTRSQGFEAHVDWMDGIIVQVAGNKQWAVYDPIAFPLPRADSISPLSNSNLMNKTHEPSMKKGKGGDLLSYLPDMSNYSADSKEDFVLIAGDVAYIPRGFVHEAVALPSSISSPLSDEDLAAAQLASAQEPRGTMDLSLHLTFGIEVATHFSVEVLIQHFVKVSLPEIASGKYNDILRLQPDRSIEIEASGETRSIESSEIVLRATEESSAEDVLRVLISATAGLHSSMGVERDLGDSMGGTHALRRAVGVTEKAIFYPNLNPVSLLDDGIKELFATNLAPVVLYAVALDHIQVEYTVNNVRIRLRLHPSDHIRASFSAQQPRAINSTWCNACIKNCNLCATTTQGSADFLNSTLALEVHDLNIISRITGVSVAALEELLKSQGEIIGYFDKDALLNYLQEFEWSSAADVVRRAYRGLFEGFDDESLEGRLSDGSSAAELHVDEDRLCFAWKSFISDIKEDRRQREVTAEATLRAGGQIK